MMKDRNKGFSYVEMIIVLAIMGVMVALLSITVGTVNRNNALRASEQLESYVNNARANALTKGTTRGVLSIAKDSTGVYAYVGEKQYTVDNVKNKGDKVCNGKVEVTVNGVAGTLMYIEFKQSTGGLTDGMIVSNPLGVDYVEVKTKNGNTTSSFKVYTMGKVVR